MIEPPLELLLEDGPLLAFNKPPGLLVQGVPAGIPTLEAQVKDWLKQKYNKPGNVYLGIIHRLDRPTSGVVVFARNSKAAARLSEQFRNRQVRKIYYAVVSPPPEEPQGVLTDQMRKVPDRAHAEIVSAGTPGAQEARLSYQTLLAFGGFALLEIVPDTGRMHQIRVQFASRGWPVVGDSQYGSATFPGFVAPDSGPDAERIPPICLHAGALTLLHPIRYEPLTITAAYPPHWSALPWPTGMPPDLRSGAVGLPSDSLPSQ